MAKVLPRAFALAVLVVVELVLGSIPFLVLLFHGAAWGLLAALAVGAAFCALIGKLDGGDASLFRGVVLDVGVAAIVIGFLVGLAWQVLT